MILAILSATLRLTLVFLLYRLVTRFRHILSRKEKFGAGFMGGSGFLTVWVILDFHRSGTPFDTWAGFFFSFGAVLFFWGFIERKIGHEGRNEVAVEQARRHLAERSI